MAAALLPPPLFQRHVTIWPAVLCLIDHTHRTCAKHVPFSNPCHWQLGGPRMYMAATAWKAARGVTPLGKAEAAEQGAHDFLLSSLPNSRDVQEKLACYSTQFSSRPPTLCQLSFAISAARLSQRSSSRFESLLGISRSSSSSVLARALSSHVERQAQSVDQSRADQVYNGALQMFVMRVLWFLHSAALLRRSCAEASQFLLLQRGAAADVDMDDRHRHGEAREHKLGDRGDAERSRNAGRWRRWQQARRGASCSGCGSCRSSR